MKPQVNLAKRSLCGPSDVAKEIDIAKVVVEEWSLQHGELKLLNLRWSETTDDIFPRWITPF